MDEYQLRDDLMPKDKIQDDILMLELYKKLMEMKNDRKKAEQNAEILNNRVNLLKNEEFKVIIVILIHLRHARKYFKRKRKLKMFII